MAENKFSLFGKKEENNKNNIPADKSKSKKLIDLEEKVDPIKGDIYYPIETVNSSIKIKEKGKPWTPTFFKKHEAKTIGRKIISSKLLVVCMEITYPIEKIEKILKVIFSEKETFIKFIFFSNRIYKTEILFSNKISEKEILNMIKKQKSMFNEEELIEHLKTEYAKNLCNAFKGKEELEILSQEQILQKAREIKNILQDNILLYDSIEEAFQISKEDLIFPKRKYIIENNEYVIEENKYFCIFSGEEKGSILKKNELQNIIKDIRKKESNVNLILTNPSNLIKISTLGFRWIRTIDI